MDELCTPLTWICIPKTLPFIACILHKYPGRQQQQPERVIRVVLVVVRINMKRAMDCINHPLLSMWVGSGQSIALYLPSWRRIAVRLVHTPKVHPIMLCFVGRTDGMWSKNNNTDNTRMTWTKLLLLLHLNVQQR